MQLKQLLVLSEFQLIIRMEGTGGGGGGGGKRYKLHVCIPSSDNSHVKYHLQSIVHF